MEKEVFNVGTYEIFEKLEKESLLHQANDKETSRLHYTKNVK